MSKELRNAERRRTRLKRRARQLSDQDLLAVISLRNHEKALSGHVADETEPSAEEDEDNDDDEKVVCEASASACSQSPANKRKKHA